MTGPKSGGSIRGSFLECIEVEAFLYPVHLCLRPAGICLEYSEPVHPIRVAVSEPESNAAPEGKAEDVSRGEVERIHHRARILGKQIEGEVSRRRKGRGPVPAEVDAHEVEA